jgi:hypothetical protein
MSEHEDPQQIGRLAEDYARLKDQVHGLDERVERAHRAFTIAAISFEEITVQEDRLTLADSAEAGDSATCRLQNLLNTRELIDLFHERNRVRGELDEVRARLRGWLTHI